jgi:transcriptional regulator with XRE-family HTH domain/ketosteroid isomerase-like protein
MKMKQPDLGRKIAELRRAKGLTQEELVEKCNLSVRTLQRIESGEVSPRTHTLRVLFAALDQKIYDTSKRGLRRWTGPVRELFNLKTDTMKKLSILSLPVVTIAIILLLVSFESKAQTNKKVAQIVASSNGNLVRWFNNNQIDSILTLYSEDACIVAQGCGFHVIRSHYQSQFGTFEFEDLQTTSLKVRRDIAMEKGRWTVRLFSGQSLSGEYLTEWQRFGKKWLITNDISGTY